MKNIAILITILFVIIYIFAAVNIPCVQAMGKRAATVQQTESEEFVLPEIEIITKPEADMQLLSGKRQSSKGVIRISPKEVLPAVGKDVTATAKHYRIIDSQKALKNAGFPVGPIDGKMGPKTKKAIKDFQKTNNLTVDGIVGIKTWSKLKPYLNPLETEGKD